MSEAYFSNPALSRSDLRLIATNPALWWKQRNGLVPRPAPSKEMAFGSALDAMLCDGKGPDPLPPNWVQIPDSVLASNGARAGGKYKEWLSQYDGLDCVLLTQRDIDRLRAESAEQRKALEACVESILGHTDAAALMTHVERMSQVSSKWMRDGVAVKSLPDLVIPYCAVVDLKTSADVAAEWHVKSIRKYWYDCQAFMQREGHLRDTGKVLPVIHVVVRNVEPYDVAVYELDDDILESGEERTDHAIYRYKAMAASGVWQRPGHGQIIKLGRPRWWQYESEYQLTEEESEG